MQEVEVKAILDNKEDMLLRLHELGIEFGAPKVQDDTVYAEKAGSLEEFLSNELFLRLRVIDGGKVIFTAKHHPGRTAAIDGTFPTEHEVEVESREIMEKILLLQGYQEVVHIRKTRSSASYKEWEICLDEVEGLGAFIEVEHLVAEGTDVEEVYENLKAFIRTLGVPDSSIINSRYDIMLLEKRA